MNKGLIVGGLGLGALLLLASTSSASTNGGGGGGGGGPTGPDCFDSHLPPDMKAQVQEMLTSKTVTPTDLEAAALAAETGGFPKVAGCLRKRAQELRTKAEMELQQKGGMPFKIRYGDIPYLLAQYYTGDGSRFKELATLNPQIGQLKTVNGVSNYTNWKPGLDILIPKGWNPLDKPIPPPAQGGGNKPPDGQQSGEGQVADPDDDIEVHPGWVDLIEDLLTPDPVQPGNEGGEGTVSNDDPPPEQNWPSDWFT